MKYLLVASIAALLSTAGYAQQTTDDIYAGSSFNDDVNRKVNLDANGVVEVVSDIKFKPLRATDDAYYFVIPSDLEEHVVSITAVASTTQAEAKVQKVSKIPADLQSIVNS